MQPTLDVRSQASLVRLRHALWGNQFALESPPGLAQIPIHREGRRMLRSAPSRPAGKPPTVRMQIAVRQGLEGVR